MTGDPPFTETTNAPLQPPFKEAAAHSYADYTPFMQKIAEIFEMARANSTAMKSLIFYVNTDRTFFSFSVSHAIPDMSDIEMHSYGLGQPAQLKLILSLVQPFDAQLKAEGIEPTLQQDWPEFPVNCTRQCPQSALATLLMKENPADSAPIRTPALNSADDLHMIINALAAKARIRGVIDGGLTEADERPRRPFHASLRDIENPHFIAVPFSLTGFKNHFDRAFKEGYPFVTAYLNPNQETQFFMRHRTSADALQGWAERTDRKFKLMLALTTTRDFMKQLYMAPYRYVSPYLATQYPIVTPGVFPDIPPQKKITDDRPRLDI